MRNIFGNIVLMAKGFAWYIFSMASGITLLLLWMSYAGDIQDYLNSYLPQPLGSIVLAVILIFAIIVYAAILMGIMPKEMKR